MAKDKSSGAGETLAGENGHAGWRNRVVSRSLDRAVKRSLDRGQAFVDAATALLEENGSDGFTVQQVADSAGQSLRTLYQHFKSKDDLLLAVFEEQVELHTARVQEQVDRYSDPLDRLAALVTAAAEAGGPTGRSGLEGRSVALSHFWMKLASTHPEELAQVQAPFVRLVADNVIAAVGAGAIPACDPQKMAYMITTLKSAYLHSVFLGNELGVPLPTPLELARFCLEGVGGSLPGHWSEPTS